MYIYIDLTFLLYLHIYQYNILYYIIIQIHDRWLSSTCYNDSYTYKE